MAAMELEGAATWMLGGAKRKGDEPAEALVAGARKSAKGGGASSKDDDIAKQLIKSLTLLALQNAQLLREVTGAVFHTVLIKVDSPVAIKLKEVGADYHTKATEKPKDHGMGPPFLHVWVALIQILAQADIKQIDKEVLVGYWNNRATKVEREQLEAEIRHCRQKLTYKKDKAKISFALSMGSLNFSVKGRSLEEAVLGALSSLGATKAIGPPPAGALEREARALLAKFA